MSYPKRPLRERFYRNVKKSDACWLWSAGRFGRGYGAFLWTDGRVIQAHRAAWLIEVGPIPAGLYVCHKCDVPTCVRHDHLFLGTNSDNQLDASAKGRLKGHPGDLHPMRKLDSAAVTEVRRRIEQGERLGDTARSFGVSASQVSRIARRLNWRDVA